MQFTVKGGPSHNSLVVLGVYQTYAEASAVVEDLKRQRLKDPTAGHACLAIHGSLEIPLKLDDYLMPKEDRA